MTVDFSAVLVGKNLSSSRIRVLGAWFISSCLGLSFVAGVLIYVLAGLVPRADDVDGECDVWWDNPGQLEPVILEHTAPVNKTQKDCDLFSCFDVYKCGRSRSHPEKLTAYVYPYRTFLLEDSTPVTEGLSKEYWDVLVAVKESPYFTNDPNEACLFVPSIDLLNHFRVRPHEAGQALASLPHWNGGSNHLIFSMVLGTSSQTREIMSLPSGQAIIAGAGLSSDNYRRDFDVSIPVFNHRSAGRDLYSLRRQNKDRWLAVFPGGNVPPEVRTTLRSFAQSRTDFLLLEKCDISLNHGAMERCHNGAVVTYPEILTRATFCLVIRNVRLMHSTFLDSVQAGCIPVVFADDVLLPFSEVLDWSLAALHLHEIDLPRVMEILIAVPQDKITAMQKQLHWLYNQYFSSMKKITWTALDILQDRYFPLMGRTYYDWNAPKDMKSVLTPPIYQDSPLKNDGFTAVILTYDRLESLFTLVQHVSEVPSVALVLVVWNNQAQAPPPASAWPQTSKPLKVIQTSANKLSNRFFPYREIPTEAILALDDDILMLTVDELEFGYEVWKEFPDRIVGFPSRTHLWDNSTSRWKYQSEWTNQISMVLTGAAFYHRFWNQVFTHQMPSFLRDWVDQRMNCEDILMNFVVANATGKAPIKVAPRKKFKCPECVKVEISADDAHMESRSECVNKFVEVFGHMPLKTVEFRADPVLYKDNFPNNLKRFKDVGSM